MRPSHHRRPAVAAVTAALLLLSPACSAETPPTPAPGAPTAAPTAEQSGEPLVGSDCPNLPDSGPGSVIDLSNRDWIDALGQVPALSQLSVTVALSELSGNLQGVGEATVFAPDDEAFRRLGLAGGRRLLTDPRAAIEVLSFHIVPRRLSTQELDGSHATVAGRSVEISEDDQTFTVNGQATIVCGPLQTENATIYLVDHVLQPR